MTTVVVTVLVFSVICGWLLCRTSKAPNPMTEDQLLAEGYTRPEARIEARRQRQEQRQHLSARSNALRARELHGWREG